MTSPTMTADSKKLFVILLIAFFLRIAGAGFGLPAIYHQDEPMMVNHALAIGASGDWNTRFYVIPPFVSYFLFLLYGMYFSIGRLLSVFPDAEEFAISFFRDPTPFYLIGRIAVGACFGVATVWLVARMGKRFFTANAGLWGALFLSLALVHVQYSHYVYADAPVTFAILLLLYWHLKILKEPRTRSFVIAGGILGWAVSIKYTALYFLPTTFLCYLLIHRKEAFSFGSLRNLFSAGLSSLIVFAVMAPYTFLDWRGFFSAFLHQSNAQRYVGIFHYLTYTLTSGTSLFLMLLSGAGVWAAYRSKPKETGLVAFFAVTFYLINTWAGQPFSRYVLPIVPIICLSAGIGMTCIRSWLKRPRAYFSLFAAGVLLSLAVPTLYGEWLFIQKDTRAQCAECFLENVPADSTVVMDSRFYGPHLKQSAAQLDDKKLEILNDSTSDVRTKRLDFEKRAVQAKTAYRIYTLRKKEEPDTTEFLIQRPLVRAQAADLERIGARYLVLNYIGVEDEFHQLKKDLAGRIKLAKIFSPYRDLAKKTPIDPHSSTAAPHLPKELFSRSRLGPYLEVYEIGGEP
jgi:4-amino-4-deoxy-L-arabinose transferase-like glycosyltransferase